MADARLALNAARGQSLLIVVLFHAYIVLQPRGMVYGGYQYIIDALTYIPMPLLFFISGAKCQSIISRASDKPLLNRIAAYLYLYVVWTTIYIAAHMLFGGKSIAIKALTFHDLIALFAFPTTVLWFLYSLALYFLLARLICRLDVRAQMAIGALLSITAYSQSAVFDGTLAYKVIGHFFYFLLGVNFGSKLQRTIFGAKWASAMLLMLSYPILVLLVKVAGIAASPVVIELMGVLGLSAFMVFSSTSLRLPFQNIFQAIGHNALPIYLLHSLFLDILLAIHDATDFPGNSTPFKLLNPFLLSTAAIFGSLAVYRTFRFIPGLFFAPVGVLKSMSASIGKAMAAGDQLTSNLIGFRPSTRRQAAGMSPPGRDSRPRSPFAGAHSETTKRP